MLRPRLRSLGLLLFAPRLPDAGLLKSDVLAQRLVETMTEDP